MRSVGARFSNSVDSATNRHSLGLEMWCACARRPRMGTLILMTCFFSRSCLQLTADVNAELRVCLKIAQAKINRAPLYPDASPLCGPRKFQWCRAGQPWTNTYALVASAHKLASLRQCALGNSGQAQSSLLAIRAPSAMASSFAHMMLG